MVEKYIRQGSTGMTASRKGMLKWRLHFFFFFFFCVPSYISGVRHSFPSSFFVFPAISLGFTILFLLLLLCFQLYLWGSPFFFFWVPSCISGVRHSSSSGFPALFLGFTILLLLLGSQLYLWGSPFFSFFFFSFCVPSYILRAHHFW